MPGAHFEMRKQPRKPLVCCSGARARSKIVHEGTELGLRISDEVIHLRIIALRVEGALHSDIDDVLVERLRAFPVNPRECCVSARMAREAFLQEPRDKVLALTGHQRVLRPH